MNRLSKIARISDSAYEVFGEYVYKTLLEPEKYYNITEDTDSVNLSPKESLYSEDVYNNLREKNRALKEEGESFDLPISYDQFRLAFERIRVRIIQLNLGMIRGGSAIGGSMSDEGVLTLYTLARRGDVSAAAKDKKNAIIHEVSHYLNSIRSWSTKEEPTSYVTYRSPGGINQFHAGTPEYALSTEEAQARLIDFRSNIYSSPRLMYSFLNQDENAGAKDFALSGLDKIYGNEIIKKNPKIKKRYYSRLYEMYLEYKNKFDKNFKNILSNYRLGEGSISNNDDDKFEDMFFAEAAKIPKYRETVKEFFINESSKPGFGVLKYKKTIMELGLEDLAKRILTKLPERSPDSLFSKGYVELAKHFNLEYIIKDAIKKLISHNNFSKIVPKIKDLDNQGILDDIVDEVRDIIINYTENDIDNFSSLLISVQNDLPLVKKLGLADYLKSQFKRMIFDDDFGSYSSIFYYKDLVRGLGMDDIIRDLFKSEMVTNYNVSIILRNIDLAKELGLGLDEGFRKIVAEKLDGWRNLDNWQAIAKSLFNHPPDPLVLNKNESIEKESSIDNHLIKLSKALESLGMRKESSRVRYLSSLI